MLSVCLYWRTRAKTTTATKKIFIFEMDVFEGQMEKSNIISFMLRKIIRWKKNPCAEAPPYITIVEEISACSHGMRSACPSKVNSLPVTLSPSSPPLVFPSLLLSLPPSLSPLPLPELSCCTLIAQSHRPVWGEAESCTSLGASRGTTDTFPRKRWPAKRPVEWACRRRKAQVVMEARPELTLVWEGAATQGRKEAPLACQ